MKSKLPTRKKNLFQNQPWSLVLILIAMVLSALLIYRIIPKPGNDTIGSKQTQPNKCTLSMECSKK